MIKEFFDITGHKFGNLTAIAVYRKEQKYDSKGNKCGNIIYWKCQCDCGNVTHARYTDLKKGRCFSCGCIKRSKGKKPSDMIGKKYGRLTVLSLDHKKQTFNTDGKKSGNRLYYKCQCDCGNIKITDGTFLRQGLTKTCGCGKMLDYEKGEVGLKELYSNYKRNAEKKNRIFEFSEDEFKNITSEDCVYCGSKPKSSIKAISDYSEYIYNGIDRIETDKGYTKKNSVPCCEWCNIMKKDYTLEEFKAQVLRIVNHLGLR